MRFKLNNITKLSLAMFFVNLFFLAPVMTFFYIARGMSLFQIVSLESVLVLTMVFVEVPSGIFADKYGRKNSIILAMLLQLITIPIYIWGQGFWIFALAFAISGAGFSFVSGAAEALIYDTLKKEGKENQMKQAMGTFGSAVLFAMFISPLIGSYVASDLASQSYLYLIYATGAAFLIALLWSLSLEEIRHTHRKKEEHNPIKMFKESFNLIKKNKGLYRLVLLSILSSPFIFVLSYLYQPYFREAGIPIIYFGVIAAAALGLSAIAQKFAYKFEKKLGMKNAILLVTLMPGIFYILMALTRNPLFVILSFVGIFAIHGFKTPLFSDYKNAYISSFQRATVLSVIHLLAAMYHVATRPVIGWLADINLSYAFLAIGITVIIVAVFIRVDESHLKKQKSSL